MPAAFPASIKVFSNKQDRVDIVDAVDVDDLQSEVYAIETVLGVQPGLSAVYTSAQSVKNRLDSSETDLKNLMTVFGTTGTIPESQVSGLVADLAAKANASALPAVGSVGDIAALYLGVTAAAGTSGRYADAAHRHAVAQVASPIALAMPGATSVRSSLLEYIVPQNMSLTGFQARIGAGSGTVVQLLKNGTGIGSASGGLSQTVAATAFSAVTFTRGNRLGLSIVTAGSGASDVSVSIDAVFTP